MTVRIAPTMTTWELRNEKPGTTKDLARSCPEQSPVTVEFTRRVDALVHGSEKSAAIFEV